MNLGSLSVSLNVKNLKKSCKFYEALGFEVIDGQHSHQEGIALEKGQDWLILQNEATTLGLFQGMLDAHTLTFHPKDVRKLQAHLQEKDIELLIEADESTDGPALAMLSDPDGNPIILDQT